MSEKTPWLKLWKCVLSDPAHMNMSAKQAGQWLRLLLFVGANGNKGSWVIPNPMGTLLERAFEVESLRDFFNMCKQLPNVEVEGMQNGHGEIVVTFKKWYSYQVDPTHAERKRRARSKTVPGHALEVEKRREEKTVSLFDSSSLKDVTVEKNGLRFASPDAPASRKPVEQVISVLGGQVREPERGPTDLDRAEVHEMVEKFKESLKRPAALRKSTVDPDGILEDEFVSEVEDAPSSKPSNF